MMSSERPAVKDSPETEAVSLATFGFHPVIERWFQSRFAGPTEPQTQGWPLIAAGRHTLIAAPTGSGKTLTAFLAVIDRLLKDAAQDRLSDELRVVYVSPLRALSNDMHRNLETPLEEIRQTAAEAGLTLPLIRCGLRTGDTPASQRAALVRRPPHILVTTPESLYLMLTAEKARQTLESVETVIVDEIHALVRDKRGSHLALSMERLEAVSGRRLQRIGLSATQRPIQRMAAFLVGGRERTDGPSNAPSPVGWTILSDEIDSPSPESARASLLPKEVLNDGQDCPSYDPSRLPSPASRLIDDAASACAIVDVGHGRQLDLAIEIPPSELGAVCMHEQWAEVNARVVELINAHRSTLIFVNTRRMAERVTHQLSELLGEDAVSSHHGSLSAEIRLQTERRLKSGELKAVVATASLELGLDVGYIDLVIQLGSPQSIATFLQRIGRSGHSLGLIPKGRLFALTRDQLLECMALMRAVRSGRLDAVPIPDAPLDILAQQIVAETAAQEWGTDELFDLFRQAYPYRTLSRRDFDRTVQFLSEGVTQSSGRGRVYLHHDQVGRRIRARKGARIAATCNAGAIPEIGSFRVVAEPDNTVVGTLDEDFAVESQAGDVFLLGNTSWRILHVRGGDVTVADAHGAPPTVPFWRGEGPGRTLELSEEVSRLREDLEQRLTTHPPSVGQVCNLSEPSPKLPDRIETGATEPDGMQTRLTGEDGVEVDATGTDRLQTCPTGREDRLQSGPTNAQRHLAEIERWLVEETGCSQSAAEQIVRYAAAQKTAIGLLPTQQRVVFERFFDESGGMQMVIHAPFGSRVNRAWGLAMRKRFCRSFDFELQASADNDGFILSLGPQHSFPLESMFPMLTSGNVQGLLEQALLVTPMFESRWRWNVTRALLVLRRQNGKKVPPAFQRFRANDLLTAVFPQLTGCQENVVGDIEFPDHPLVQQTLDDCLHEALDLCELQQVLGRIERGEIQLIARDTREPSPFCYELLNANPYAFLDGGEIQERRTRAVSTRRSLTVESVSDLGRLDPAAIDRVRQEAEPVVRNADELHDALLSRVVLPSEETAEWERSDWETWRSELVESGRATRLTLPGGRTLWAAAERLPAALAAFPEAVADPPLDVPPGVRSDWSASEARTAMVRGLLETCGPITAAEVAERLSLTPGQAGSLLEALEGEGVVLRGRFTPPDCPSYIPSSLPSPASSLINVEWCHRRLLARIHRLTLEGLRKQIEPVGVDVFVRFLTRHHGLAPDERRTGPNGLFEVVAMLQGLDVPALAWERDLLPARVDKYRPEWLDELCLTGEIGWGRCFPPKQNPDRGKPMAGLTRIAPLSLFLRADLVWLTPAGLPVEVGLLSGAAQEVYELLRGRGAMFSSDLMAESRLLPSQLEDALGELVTRGLVTADGFAGLRQLIAEKPASSRSSRRSGLARKRTAPAGTGRWSLWRTPVVGQAPACQPNVGLDHQADQPETEQREIVEQWAWQLLRRWGVVFRDLLIREAGAPRWFELLQVYRRLEARGEIRGGRFIRGVGGEQFALGESVRRLRALRDESDAQPSQPTSAEQPTDDVTGSESAERSTSRRCELVVLSAADPLNLIGILTPHPRIPSTASNRIAYCDGVPAAALQAGEVQFFENVPEPLRPQIAERLTQHAPPALPPPAFQFIPHLPAAAPSAAAPQDEPPIDERESNRKRKKRDAPRHPNRIPRPTIS